MIPVYWINLDRRSDRRNEMIKQFQDLNITNHIRISGETGNSNPIINCCKSHFKAIKTAYLDGHNLVMIVEDDIILANYSIIFDLIKHLPNDWECFQCHYCDPNLIKYLIDNNNINNCLIQGYLMSCACYLINRKGMERMLKQFCKDEKYELNVTFTEKAEGEEFVYRYINTYSILYPFLNTKEDFVSDLRNNKKINYDNMLMTDEFLKLNKNYQIKDVLNLEYDRHYFNNEEEIKKEVYKLI